MKYALFFFCFSISASWGLSPMKKVVLVDNMYNMTADPPLFKDRVGVRAMVQRNGAKLHTYRVTMIDGCILQLNRLVLNTPEEMRAMPGKGTPVVVLHGLLATFDIWMSDGKKMDLPFLLAEQGFDVWLPDRRGNYFSRLHETLSKEDPRFWDFTLEENASDLAACIDAIIQVTKYPKVFFIGHSAACYDYFVMAAALPEYNDKIIASIQMAGAPFPLNKTLIDTPGLRLGLANMEILYEFVKSMGLKEMFPRRQSNINLITSQCTATPFQDYCIDSFDVASGPHRQNLDRTRISEQMSRWPAGGGIKSFIHNAQIFKYGFNRFDHGPKINLKRYGRRSPPPYDRKNLIAPLAFYFGPNDALTRPIDLDLIKQLPNVLFTKMIPDPGFNHIDFIFGKNRREVLYDIVIEDILKMTHDYYRNVKF